MYVVKFSLVWHDCWARSLMESRENLYRVSDNNVERKMFGAKRK
jgi:hypothetical protein